MSISYGLMSDRQVEYIEGRLNYESQWKTRLYSWLKEYGYVAPLPLGLKEIIDAKVSNAEAGLMSYNTEEFPEYQITLSTNSYKILLIGRTLVYSRRDLQAWANNSSNIGKETSLEAVGIDRYQQKLYRQIEGFSAWGTNMRDALATDKWHATSEITGMFSGFTAFGAGADEDNNVNAAYDYYTSINNAVEDCREAGYDAEDYTIFSSIATKKDADGNTSNHRIGTYGFETELKACLAKPEVDRWVDSPAFVDYATTAHRMIVVPNIRFTQDNELGSEEQSDKSRPFTFYQEPIQVYPAHQGTFDKNGLRYITIYVAMAWAQTNTDFLVRSGTLTFTAP